jgi:hypothetical protein
LLAGLRVDAKRMRATLTAASPGILAEWTKPGPAEPTAEDILGRALDEAVDELLERRSDPALDPRGYLGTSERTINATLARADRYLEGA